MIVVSDTSPICYLILIDGIELLQKLYGYAIVPQTVYEELTAVGSPAKVQSWIAQYPSWLEVQSVVGEPDIGLSQLDAGERAAIALAEQIKAHLVILDERTARKVAMERGLRVIGLLGILGAAADRELVNFAVMIDRLRQTNFWASPQLIQLLLERYADNG
jgi:predicted nucleic acid-binding protein